MSTCRNGQICYFKKSKKNFRRTLVQGGRGGQPQSVQVRTGGEGGPKSGNSERTYFMDAPYIHQIDQNNEIVVNLGQTKFFCGMRDWRQNCAGFSRDSGLRGKIERDGGIRTP